MLELLLAIFVFACPASPCVSFERAPLGPVRIKQPKSGTTSWAIMNESGRIQGHSIHRTHKSASLSKAMLMVAFLQNSKDRQLSDYESQTLRLMITQSDNDAADTVLSWAGTSGLDRVASRSHMKDFDANGYWANADLSPHDQVMFWSRVNRLIPMRHRAFGMNLFANITSYQRWGIASTVDQYNQSVKAQARRLHTRAGQRYFLTHHRLRISHKSGWRPEGNTYRFNQAGRICQTGRGCIHVAFLTEGASSESVAHFGHERAIKSVIKAWNSPEWSLKFTWPHNI